MGDEEDRDVDPLPDAEQVHDGVPPTLGYRRAHHDLACIEAARELAVPVSAPSDLSALEHRRHDRLVGTGHPGGHRLRRGPAGRNERTT
ncbi:MAG TPA: hypothetical protein VL242_07320 [Sorangium sp.]|nr:hypothetical protein [Sorangium sp.]